MSEKVPNIPFLLRSSYSLNAELGEVMNWKFDYFLETHSPMDLITMNRQPWDMNEIDTTRAPKFSDDEQGSSSNDSSSTL